MPGSPPGCVSLRLPQQGLSAKSPDSPNTKHFAAYCHHFNQKHRVPGASLGHIVGPSNATFGVLPMNWLPGDMNPATGEAPHTQFLRRKKYEYTNRLL